MKEPNMPQADLDTPPRTSRNTDIESNIAAVYDRNPFAKTKKETLIAMFNKEDFYEEGFRGVVEGWNNNEEKTKGFRGMHSQIERISCKNGTFEIYHFLESDAVKFGFNLKP